MNTKKKKKRFSKVNKNKAEEEKRKKKPIAEAKKQAEDEEEGEKWYTAKISAKYSNGQYEQLIGIDIGYKVSVVATILNLESHNEKNC